MRSAAGDTLRAAADPRVVRVVGDFAWPSRFSGTASDYLTWSSGRSLLLLARVTSQGLELMAVAMFAAALADAGLWASIGLRFGRSPQPTLSSAVGASVVAVTSGAGCVIALVNNIDSTLVMYLGTELVGSAAAVIAWAIGRRDSRAATSG